MKEQDKQDSKPVTRADRYEADLEKAKRELEQVEERLEEVDQEKLALELRRSKLQTTIEVLGPICRDLGEEEHDTWTSDWAEIAKSSIQECCYRALVEEGAPLSAISIRFRLEDRGINLSRYRNPLAVIHTSLKRIPERVHSYKKQEWVGSDSERVAWVRYYEAIKDSVAEKSAATNQ